MLKSIRRAFGDSNDRELKRINKYVDQINQLEPEMQALTDDELRAKTPYFRERYEAGETLEELLPEAFAVVREASIRVLGLRPYDVQLIGGVVLHEGNNAEMKTGEGKTLAATMPAYLNALPGKGVHIITVNEYLATRDKNTMGQIYEFLGLTVGLNINGMSSAEKQEAYAADITYGTNNEFGFDYLRDNMVVFAENMVQRPLNYAIIDEVDSILIDEARTPLIISGKAAKSTNLYATAAQFARRLKAEDYKMNETETNVTLTEAGVAKAEQAFKIENLFDPNNMTLHHHINQAVKALVVMRRDRNYVVENGEVVIVDDFTGRLMHGRRYSDGLHQSIEAKEGLDVQSESMTLATITLQNFFRMYQKLAGMTGTAKTEEDEFRSIYNLEVVIIPTNMPMIREDLPDIIYKTEEAKFSAVIREIVERNKLGQPLLVGTVTIENSERISDLLTAEGIEHSVLNAKFHEQEAEIVARAGDPGRVTIATNMAGRGTDIVLGEGVAALGGLHIVATERHESRRIDNQLRGRAGRQGDPGSTQFFLSLEDDLMRRFGGEQMQSLMDRMGIEDDQPIESKMVTRSIENSQRRVEANNFDARRVVLQYDDVMNKHRGVIYSQRSEVLTSENLREPVLAMIYSFVERLVNYYLPEEIIPEEWNLDELLETAEQTFLKPGTFTKRDIWGKEPEEVLALFNKVVVSQYDEREAELGEQMREFEKVVVLKVVDSKWMDHIDAMDQLRQGIHFRAYGQANPLMEYQREGYDMFNMMIQGIEEDVATNIMKAQVTSNLEREKLVEEEGTSSAASPTKRQPVVREKKIGRNAPCPCGSGKKYKHCCGAN